MKQQILLPLVPDGATPVNDLISIVNHDDQWTWFYGSRPVFGHPQSDRDSFRMFSAQLVCQGACKQVEIVKAFGVSAISVKRSVKQYRQEGVQSFYRPRPTRGGTVMTPHVIEQAQDLLNQGNSRGETASQLGIQYETLRKAINQGRLTEPPGGKSDPQHDASDKSQRGQQDVAAADGVGMACTRLVERVGAAFGLLPGGAPTQFQSCRDVSFGGVLCAMPALTQNGLFRHLDQHFPSLSVPNGEQVSLPLAERGSWIGSRRDGLWVREIRKLTASGHQTSLISSAYGHEALQDAGALFSRVGRNKSAQFRQLFVLLPELRRLVPAYKT